MSHPLHSNLIHPLHDVPGAFLQGAPQRKLESLAFSRPAFRSPLVSDNSLRYVAEGGLTLGLRVALAKSFVVFEDLLNSAANGETFDRDKEFRRASWCSRDPCRTWCSAKALREASRVIAVICKRAPRVQ
jgi:hypothetical protein